MKIFEAQVSLMTEKNEADIWKIWTDVEGWTRWDDTDRTEIDGPFAAGSTIKCYDKSEEEPRCMKIVSSVNGQEFTDQTELPFGKIMTLHTIKSLAGKIQVTHKMTAEIEDGMSEMFGSEIWPHIQSGIYGSLNNLIRL